MEEARLRSTAFGKLETETLGEPLHVDPVHVVEPGVLMPGELKLGRDARHLHAADAAVPGKALARPTMRRTAGGIGLPAVAVRVESQRVAVDLPPGCVFEDEAGGPFDVGAAELAEGLADALDVFETDAEIQIVVRARLLPEQRVDAPAALDPYLDAVVAETSEDVEDVDSRQLNCACARPRPSASSASTASAAREISAPASSSGPKSERT